MTEYQALGLSLLVVGVMAGIGWAWLDWFPKREDES